MPLDAGPGACRCRGTRLVCAGQRTRQAPDRRERTARGHCGAAIRHIRTGNQRLCYVFACKTFVDQQQQPDRLQIHGGQVRRRDRYQL